MSEDDARQRGHWAYAHLGVAELDALVSELTAREVFARRVNMAYASHGRDMDGLLEEFRTALGPLQGVPVTVSVPQQVTVNVPQQALLLQQAPQQAGPSAHGPLP
jgi:acyl transferase domain-containing protein